jgi:predicted lipid-binding transport protein (Tim44 family)
MKTLAAVTVAFLAAALLVVPAAEAKRFGGGMSLGKQYSAPRTAPQRQASQAASAPSRAASPNKARGGAGGWLGPLAGLAAGGLLASLFFGDAFEGIQPMDILLLAALVFGGVMLFRAMRRSAGGSPATAGAHGGAAGPAGSGPGLSLPPSVGGDVPAAVSGDQEAPPWFDGPAFVEAAKTHFTRLQAAWDEADFRDIREYTTPRLFAELQRERQRLGDGAQLTEVVTLNADLLGVRREEDMAVASVAFSGLIREEESGTADRFEEIWHVQHPWATREGDWLITGIRQADAEGA